MKIYFENTLGLPKCYNQTLSEMENDEDIIIFMHDDIYILDFFWLETIRIGLDQFDLVGVAGNRSRAPSQPSWHFILSDNAPGLEWDKQENLSGIVGHGDNFPPYVSYYGTANQKCKLLDGLFLATKRGTLVRNGIKFDECFLFHFYDMDLCRQFESKNLSAGTISLSLLHQSGGEFATPPWRESYQRYLNKWTT